MAKRPKTATSREPWAEESCMDYERDSDDEWFECFDADDLDDAKEEEEEEEMEAEDDRDWLEDDEETKDKNLAATTAIKFESFLNWNFVFDGEPKLNEVDLITPLVAMPTLRDSVWSSAYGCIGDDWGGNPFARLDAAPVNSRRRWSDEDSINLLKFFHGKTVGKLKSIPEFQRANRHVTKAEVERQLRQLMVYEKRPEDRQRVQNTEKRWYATEEAARLFHIVDELEEILKSIRNEEKVLEAKQQELAEQLKAQLAAYKLLADSTEDKKEQKDAKCDDAAIAAAEVTPAATAATAAAAATGAAAAVAAAAQQKDKPEGTMGSNGRLHAFFVRKSEPPQQQQQQQQRQQHQGRQQQQQEPQQQQQQEEGAEPCSENNAIQTMRQKQLSLSSASCVPWFRVAESASAAITAGIAATPAAAATAAAATEANPQDAALAAHVAAAALLAAKLARGAAAADYEEETKLKGAEILLVKEGKNQPRASRSPPVPIHSTPVAQGKAASISEAAGNAESAFSESAALEGGGVLDQVASGKRMRKSALQQNSPADEVPLGAGTKRVKRRQSTMTPSVALNTAS